MRSITINPDVPATVPDDSLSPVELTSPPSYWPNETKNALIAKVTAETEGIDWDFVPDPGPPPPEPDWTAFNTAMLGDADWRPWITQDMILMSATTSASMASDATQLQTTIGIAIVVLGAPDPVAAQRWQDLANQYGIPIQF